MWPAAGVSSRPFAGNRLNVQSQPTHPHTPSGRRKRTRQARPPPFREGGSFLTRTLRPSRIGRGPMQKSRFRIARGDAVPSIGSLRAAELYPTCRCCCCSIDRPPGIWNKKLRLSTAFGIVPNRRTGMFLCVKRTTKLPPPTVNHTGVHLLQVWIKEFSLCLPCHEQSSLD
jgi:hypothetical protein